MASPNKIEIRNCKGKVQISAETELLQRKNIASQRPCKLLQALDNIYSDELNNTAQSDSKILDVGHKKREKLHSLLEASVPVVFKTHPARYFFFGDVTFLLPFHICTGRTKFIFEMPCSPFIYEK